MKVKVISAEKLSWYYDRIGEVFEAIPSYPLGYTVKTYHAGKERILGISSENAEIINEEKAMKRSDLRTGMRVVTNNGKVAIVLKDIGILALQGGFNYINNLIFDGVHSDWTVDAVYQGYTANSDVLNFQALGELVWKRSKQTPEQKQLQEVMDKIADLQKQAEILQDMVGKSSK